MKSRLTFQIKIFSPATAAAAIGLAVAGVVFATSTARRTDRRSSRRSPRRPGSPPTCWPAGPRRRRGGARRRGRPHRRADRRACHIHCADGRVVGDSAETLEGVAQMENHATRPEIVEARQHGLGKGRRHSDTLNIDMLYVAVPVAPPVDRIRPRRAAADRHPSAVPRDPDGDRPRARPGAGGSRGHQLGVLVAHRAARARHRRCRAPLPRRRSVAVRPRLRRR